METQHAEGAQVRRVAADIRKLVQERHPSHCCDGCLALHFAVSLAEARSAALKVASESGLSAATGRLRFVQPRA